VQDQLHAAAFIEKPFRNQKAIRGDDAEHCPAGSHVSDGLFRAGFV
jgi:hypothetical protein